MKYLVLPFKRFNLVVMNEGCLKCGKELQHEKGRRKKQFCNPTCRSLYWYYKNKDKKKVKVNNLNNQTQEPKDNKKKPASNESIDTTGNYINERLKKKLGIK
jgi:hypothetical protein